MLLNGIKTNVSGYGYDTSTYKYRVAVAGVYWFTVQFTLMQILKLCLTYVKIPLVVLYKGQNLDNQVVMILVLTQSFIVQVYPNVQLVITSSLIIQWNCNRTYGGNNEGYIDFSGYLIG